MAIGCMSAKKYTNQMETNESSKNDVTGGILNSWLNNDVQ